MTTSPAASAGVRPTRSISAPTTSASAYIPRTWAPMIGKTESWEWWWSTTTTYPARFITETMTPKLARLAAIAGITPGRRMISASGAAEATAGVAVPGADELSDRARVGPHRQHHGERDERDPGRHQPRHGQRVGVDPAVGEERGEDGRPQDGADDRPGEHVGDPPRPPRRGVHVAGRGADQERGRHSGADQHEARQEHGHRPEVRGEGGQRTARGGGHEPGGEHRPAAVAVHRTARHDRREPRRDEEDRGPQAEQVAVAGHQHERQRRDRRCELEHHRVDGRDRRQDEGVSADRAGQVVHAGSLADPMIGSDDDALL